VLQADDCRELDKLCRIRVRPQPLHKLVVNGGRRRGHGLGVLHDQALKRTEPLAIAPIRHRLDLLARYAVPVQHPVAEVHAPRAADLDGCSHVGPISDPEVQLLPAGGTLLQLAERLRYRYVVTMGAEGGEPCTELPPNAPPADPVRQRPGRIERYACHVLSPCHIGWVSFVPALTERNEGM